MKDNEYVYYHEDVSKKCGDKMERCIDAFDELIAPLEDKNRQLVKNGEVNKFNGLITLGYNFDALRDRFEVEKQTILKFSIILELAVSANNAWN